MTTPRSLPASGETATPPVPRRVPRFLVPVAATALTAVLTAVTDLWFLPFVAGLVLGPLARGRAQAVVPVTAMAAVGGWALVLLWRAWSGEPIGGAAQVTAALAGLPPSALLIIVVTLLSALLQGLCGVWLGRSLTSLIRAVPREDRRPDLPSGPAVSQPASNAPVHRTPSSPTEQGLS
ncbi:hypothetical protein [Plantactinospora sp. GCM10030261]|uniref:hypothetical protein n=1 Tax=Plantactinospora sp. GCM10030261 TaxID=3273420 RepID=UPI0036161D00